MGRATRKFMDSTFYGYGDSVWNRDSYLSSLLSDVTDYQYENGRRYNGYRKGGAHEVSSPTSKKTFS